MTDAIAQQIPGSRRRKVVTTLVVAVLVVVALICLLAHPVKYTVDSARRAGCIGNLKSIGLTLMSYESTKGTYLPAYLTDDQSRPAHSWRVLMLPRLGEQQLYDNYDFKQPWNSEDNMAIAKTGPGGMGGRLIYSCPSNRDNNGLDTDFVMPVGPGAISDGPQSVGYKEITDGASHTIMVAEMSDSGICWTEPRDLVLADMSDKIDDPTAPGLRSHHPGVVHVVMADSSVRSISKNIDPRVLKGLFTIAGGEPDPPDLAR
jgi:hypothetical protein